MVNRGIETVLDALSMDQTLRLHLFLIGEGDLDYMISIKEKVYWLRLVANEQLNDLLYFQWIEDDTTREAARRIMKVERLSTSCACRQKRLAGLYLRKAQSSRDRALLAYLEYVSDIKFVSETINN